MGSIDRPATRERARLATAGKSRAGGSSPPLPGAGRWKAKNPKEGKEDGESQPRLRVLPPPRKEIGTVPAAPVGASAPHAQTFRPP